MIPILWVVVIAFIAFIIGERVGRRGMRKWIMGRLKVIKFHLSKPEKQFNQVIKETVEELESLISRMEGTKNQ